MTRPAKRLRCAIYTRKSSEEGLEQSFNSLQAQREACEAFIASQRHEGWVAVDTQYDDGGYSGGSMDRPALKALLADIEAGRVSAVVVYKVDRLTRSLADFAKIVERFDAQGVSFVSVTQQFNTASSMGRLTLNVLLSFAQFEREVTGERIRDKIAASKKKGMWMGGAVPLGYDIRDRKLVPNSREADTILAIFSGYRRLGCVRRLAADLKAKGVRSKVRRARSGGSTGGVPYSRGALYSILRNRLYRGEVAHKGQVYPGEHPALVPEGLWDAVQARLDANRVAATTGARAADPSLLAGLVWDDRGNRLTPSHARKRGAKYRYYVSQALIRTDTPVGPVRRLPAQELEEVVIARLRTFLATDRDVLAALGRPDDSAHSAHTLLTSAKSLAKAISRQSTAENRASLLPFLRKVCVTEASVSIMLSKENLRAQCLQAPGTPPGAKDEDLLVLETKAMLQRCGAGIRLIHAPPNHERKSKPDEALIKAIARAYSWYNRLLAGKTSSFEEIAQEAGMHGRYMRRIFRAAFLAPDLIEDVLLGYQSPKLTVEKLRFGAPASWEEQRRRFCH